VFAHGVVGPGNGPWRRCGKLRELIRPTGWRAVPRTLGSMKTADAITSAGINCCSTVCQHKCK
jgi:hypothetical protein